MACEVYQEHCVKLEVEYAENGGVAAWLWESELACGLHDGCNILVSSTVLFTIWHTPVTTTLSQDVGNSLESNVVMHEVSNNMASISAAAGVECAVVSVCGVHPGAENGGVAAWLWDSELACEVYQEHYVKLEVEYAVCAERYVEAGIKYVVDAECVGTISVVSLVVEDLVASGVQSSVESSIDSGGQFTGITECCVEVDSVTAVIGEVCVDHGDVDECESIEWSVYCCEVVTGGTTQLHRASPGELFASLRLAEICCGRDNNSTLYVYTGSGLRDSRRSGNIFFWSPVFGIVLDIRTSVYV